MKWQEATALHALWGKVRCWAEKRILNNAAEGFFNQSNSSVNSSSVLSVTCSMLFGLFFLDRLASLPSVCDEHPYITLPGRVVVSVVLTEAETL